jgi:hypothetical protein
MIPLRKSNIAAPPIPDTKTTPPALRRRLKRFAEKSWIEPQAASSHF